MAWYVYLILIALIFFVGFGTSFFVFKKNPKYLNVQKMAKDDLQKLADKAKAQIAKLP